MSESLLLFRDTKIGTDPSSATLSFLALGFLGPEQELIKSLEVEVDGRSNIKTPLNVCLLPQVCVYFSAMTEPIFGLTRNTRRPSRESSPLETLAEDSL